MIMIIVIIVVVITCEGLEGAARVTVMYVPFLFYLQSWAGDFVA